MRKKNSVTLKGHTESLCDVLYNPIPASVYTNNGKVFMRKNCPLHGASEYLAETDAGCYMKLAHLGRKRCEDRNFYALVIPVTYKCNLNCEFCFLPHRAKKDLSLAKVKKIISGFHGPHIAISGGEPTLCPYLFEIIQHIHAENKKAILITNGLRLHNRGYVRALKKAGIDWIEFSLDGFCPETYNALKHPETVLNYKIAGLGNLEKENIPITLSTTIYKGINEKEIGRILDFAAKNNHVFRLKIRTSAKIGRFNQAIDSYSMSELLKIFSRAMRTTKESLLKNYLSKVTYYSPYGVSFKAYYIVIRGKFIFLPLLSKLILSLHYFLFILTVKLGLRRILSAAYRIKRRKMPILKCLHLRVICWPASEIIDLSELEAGVAHLYDEKIVNFFKAIILNSRL